MDRHIGVSDNERQKAAYLAFNEKHSKEGPGINFKLNGQVGKLYPDASFLPWHEAYMLAGIEPPELDWKRKQLILKYLETRASVAQGEFLALQRSLMQQNQWAIEHSGQPNASMPSEDHQEMELKVLFGVAQRLKAEYQSKYEELGDVRAPDEVARETHTQYLRDLARRQMDKIAALKL